MMLTYSELMSLETFEKRLAYAMIGYDATERRIKQILYRMPEWRRARNQIIVRDNCCDLAFPERTIFDTVYVHHLNPIAAEDVLERAKVLFDPENLICVTKQTHEAIHNGDALLTIPSIPVERARFDTCPWKQSGYFKEPNHD